MSERPALLEPPKAIPQRVVMLIAYIMKHQEPQFREAVRWVPNLKLLLSVFIEPQRDYRPDHQALDISVQKTWTLRKKWQHSAGFEDNLQVHFPYDTYFQLRKLRPAVVISHELGARSIFAAIYRLLHRKSRLVLMVYVSEQTEKSWSRFRVGLRKILLRCADIVTYQGSSGKRYLQSLNVPIERLKYCPYVANPAMVYHGSTSRDPSCRRKLLYVGQLTQRKAPDLFLKSLIAWCHDHPTEAVWLSFVGRGPLQAELEKAAKPNNLHVEMLGSVAPEKLPEIYGQHGIAVFPTLADEWGLVVDEALHSGLPVLSSEYAQATLDLVEDGKNGWRFLPDQLASTYHTITRLMTTSHDDLNAMAEYGRQSVAERTPEYGAKFLSTAVAEALEK
jgi:glycosyltransferase involved in cell wall biosynthesis